MNYVAFDDPPRSQKRSRDDQDDDQLFLGQSGKVCTTSHSMTDGSILTSRIETPSHVRRQQQQQLAAPRLSNQHTDRLPQIQV